MRANKTSLQKFAELNGLSLCILRLELNSEGYYEVIPFHSINLESVKKKQDLIYLAAVKRSSPQCIPGRDRVNVNEIQSTLGFTTSPRPIVAKPNVDCIADLYARWYLTRCKNIALSLSIFTTFR